MAEVIPASGDDWREIERRASLSEGHVERALLEILQRLVPVENRVVPVAAPAPAPTGGVTVEESCVPSGAIAADWLSYHPRMVADAPAPTGGVTANDLFVALSGIAAWDRMNVAQCLYRHPRIGPLLRGEGQAPGAQLVRVVLPEEPPGDPLPIRGDDGYWLVAATWAAARAEVERQQGGA